MLLRLGAFPRRSFILAEGAYSFTYSVVYFVKRDWGEAGKGERKVSGSSWYVTDSGSMFAYTRGKT